MITAKHIPNSPIAWSTHKAHNMLHSLHATTDITEKVWNILVTTGRTKIEIIGLCFNKIWNKWPANANRNAQQLRMFETQ